MEQDPETGQWNTSGIMDIADRKRYLENHPVKEREYLLPTPMMRRAYTAIRDRVWSRGTGIVFYATPRCGKTRCAMAVKEMISEEFPKAYVSLLSARRSSRGAGGHMYKLILSAEHHAMAARTNEDLLFDSVLTDIRLGVKLKGGNQYVLFIDELQLLSERDLEQLFCLHNALNLHKIRMTTVSFAQPEILHTRSALMASNDRQIIARFLAEMRHFDTCNNAEELAEVLRAYDEHSEFPERSGWTYTRFFLPLAFSAGFRLTSYALLIWEILQEVGGAGEIIPIEHICMSIENLLMMSWSKDCSNFVLDRKEIEAAVESTQLRSFNAALSEAEPNESGIN